MMRPVGVIAMALSLLSSAAWVDEQPTFQDLWSAAHGAPQNQPSE